MVIRRATDYERMRIKEFGETVQKEATLGYLQTSTPMNEYGPCEYWVLDHDGVCGWIVIGETMAPFKNVVSAMVFELYVLPRYRKKGYGAMLMRAALGEFRQRGYQTAHLNVFANNRAKELYKRLGFEEISTIMEVEL
ncbi:GNAT family N-acetyltransferase [Halalkalibacter sp. APA_J-10(15)]|uniref:GNAT family N-acetyltransferase n=1 Tax=unclassified Halalkalibacter TaxID=2893063 RepID=UPI001FF3901A|nr:GNAT family N-acetyltransferase [Halalkalibacter sp. APA_J-10(15)]MCK0469952.1 GNAT family N-acetyltransferase [Halalkalibacter sp. APA_J-10(15)]